MGDAQDAGGSAPLSTPQETTFEQALQTLASTPAPPAAPTAGEVSALVGSPGESVTVTPREAAVGNRRSR